MHGEWSKEDNDEPAEEFTVGHGATPQANTTEPTIADNGSGSGSGSGSGNGGGEDAGKGPPGENVADSDGDNDDDFDHEKLAQWQGR